MLETLKFNNLFKNDKFLYLLIFFFIFSLTSGPFLPDLIVVLVSIFFIYFIFNNNSKLKFTHDKLVKIFFLFYIYIVVNSFFSANPMVSLKSAFPFIRFLIFILAISFFLENKKFKYIIFYAFVTIYSLLFFDSILQSVTGSNILGFKMYSERVSSFFGDELIMGSFISRTIAIVFFLFFTLDFKKKNLLYLYIVSISTVLVLLSAERTSLFIFLIILLSSLLYFPLKKIFIYFSFILIIGSIPLLTSQYSYKRIISLTISQINFDNKINFPTYRHQLHYITAFRIFEDNKLFGAGIKSFRYLCENEKYSVQKKIKNENIVYSKRNGTYTSGTFSEGEIWIIVVNKYMSENPPDLKDYNDDIREFYSMNSDARVILSSNHFSPYVKDGDDVKVGQPLYSYYEFKNGCNTHPHNFYIQFLSELGLFGLLFLIIFYFFVCFKIIQSLFRYLFRYKTHKLPPEFIIYCGYFGAFFPLIPSGNFFNNYLCLLIFLPLSMFRLCSLK